MKMCAAAALAAAALLLAGCRQAVTPITTDPEVSAETTAKTVLEALYSCGAQDSEDFEEALARSATGESAMDDYLTGKLGDKVSPEGRDAILDNRVVTRVLNAWPASEVKVEEILLEDAYTETEDQYFYRYTVSAAPEGEEPQTFTGQITLTLTEGAWQVSALA